MAEYIDDCVRAAIEKLNDSRKSKRKLILKREQEIAGKELLLGKHVLTVLPTGYGKKFDFYVVSVGARKLYYTRKNRV